MRSCGTDRSLLRARLGRDLLGRRRRGFDPAADAAATRRPRLSGFPALLRIFRRQHRLRIRRLSQRGGLAFCRGRCVYKCMDEETVEL